MPIHSYTPHPTHSPTRPHTQVPEEVRQSRAARETAGLSAATPQPPSGVMGDHKGLGSFRPQSAPVLRLRRSLPAPASPSAAGGPARPPGRPTTGPGWPGDGRRGAGCGPDSDPVSLTAYPTLAAVTPDFAPAGSRLGYGPGPSPAPVRPHTGGAPPQRAGSVAGGRAVQSPLGPGRSAGGGGFYVRRPARAPAH